MVVVSAPNDQGGFASVVAAASKLAAEQAPLSAGNAPKRSISWPSSAAVRGPGSRVPPGPGRRRKTSETARLAGLDTVFEDFCIYARDYVVEQVREAAVNHVTTTVTKLLDQMKAPKRDEDYNDERDNSNRGYDRTNSTNSNGSNSNNDKNNNEKKGGSLPGLLFNWAKNAFSFVVHVMELQNSLSSEGFTQNINEACNIIETYDFSLEKEFAEEKSYLVKQHQTDELMLDYLRDVNMHSLPCFTIENLSRLSTFCQMFKKGKAPLERMMSIGKGNDRQGKSLGRRDSSASSGSSSPRYD